MAGREGPYKRDSNSTNYVHPVEENLSNLHKAMAYDPYGAPVLRIDDTTVQHTSKNRVKTSSYEIIDYANFQYTKHSDIWDEQTTGTASASWDQYFSMVKLSVGGTLGDKVIRQTKRLIRYTPGRINEVGMCVIFGPPTPGIRRRYGLFDDAAGMYFEDGGDGNYYVVIRNTTALGVVENRVARSNWSVDKMDGTGPSKIVADPLAIQSMLIEYDWSGAGQVEFKFIINNNAFPVHQFNHANLVSTPWAFTPFLPVRVELENVTGETAGTHTFFQGSHSVQSEGDVSVIGRVNNVSSPITGYSLTSANTFYPVISIRMKNTHLRGIVIPTQFSGATLDNSNVFIRIYRNTTLTGGTWTSYGDNSNVEYCTNSTALTDGEVLNTIFVSSGNQGTQFNFDARALLQLGRTTTTTLGDTSDIYTIAIASVNANKSGWGSINWVEVR